jgi:hypothetical protein
LMPILPLLRRFLRNSECVAVVSFLEWGDLCAQDSRKVTEHVPDCVSHCVLRLL